MRGSGAQHEELWSSHVQSGALEPYISGHIMELHHGKHHAAYVANLNKALEQLAEAEHKNDVAKMIALQDSIKFNGGGEHYTLIA